MRPAYRWTAVTVLLFQAAVVRVAEPAGLHFEHGEWELACDNTRTCRAAGYHEDQDGALPVSVLLTRKAGPGTPVTAELQLGGANDDEDFVPKGATSFALTMRIDDKPLGRVLVTRDNPIPALSPEQTRALLAALTKSSDIRWSDGRRTWRLSDKGASAVLLKMDDVQGRIGTPGALVRKGTKREDSVLPPVPAPVVNAAPVPAPDKSAVTLPAPAMKSLRAALLASLNSTKDGNCDIFSDPEREPEPVHVERLSPSRLLASTVCWRGAYNEGTGYWIVNPSAPFEPRLVTLDASGYADGVITSAQKGRGIGDCWAGREWVWDGRRFVQTEDGTTGMCKEIAAGGAWSLPTLVAEVRRATPAQGAARGR